MNNTIQKEKIPFTVRPCSLVPWVFDGLPDRAAPCTCGSVGGGPHVSGCKQIINNNISEKRPITINNIYCLRYGITITAPRVCGCGGDPGRGQSDNTFVFIVQCVIVSHSSPVFHYNIISCDHGPGYKTQVADRPLTRLIINSTHDGSMCTVTQ